MKERVLDLFEPPYLELFVLEEFEVRKKKCSIHRILPVIIKSRVF